MKGKGQKPKGNRPTRRREGTKKGNDMAMARAQRTNAALAEIAAERERQVNVEGWSEKHDDEHDAGQLARAAGCYALSGSQATESAVYSVLRLFWPWSKKWWKPKRDRRDLVKAGALIVAELERMDRLAGE